MSEQIVKWHPHGSPVPAGWKKAGDGPMHHGKYAVLITPIKRKVGKHWLAEAMPVGWLTARALAKQAGRDRNVVGVLLLRAFREGLVERRKGECSCCGEKMIEWRRLK